MSRSGWLVVGVVTALAFAVRFANLADMPPGLHYDEAFNGLDAAALLDIPLNQWPIFFTGNFGREPLFNYLLAGATALMGPGVLTLRVAAALAGALLTPALIWLAWEMAPSLGADRRRLAPWAGLALLGLLWSQIYARQALRVEFFALLETLAFAALWRAWRSNAARWWAAGGALSGLAFYTYLPVRLLPLVLGVVAVLFAWQYRAPLRQRRRGMAVAAGVGLVVALPLAIYFVQNPVSFSTRLGQVSVWQQGIDAVAHNAWATISMVAGAGDANPRANLPGRPVFDALLLGPFLVGIFYLLRYVRRPAAAFLLIWLGVMLLPTVLSDYAPSFQRAIGALPAFALIAALGLERTVAWAATRWPAGRRWFMLAGWALLLASVVITWRDFARWSASPDLFPARDVGFVQLAGLLADDDDARPVYLSPRGQDHPTVRYLLLADASPPDLRGFDGRVCVRLPESGAARFIFLPAEDYRGPALLQSYLPDSSVQVLVADPAGQPWATELAQPAGGRVELPELTALPASLDDGVEFLGYWLSNPNPQPGERLYVRLFWRATGQPSTDYTAFVHLVTPDPNGVWQQLAGVDAPPGGGSCATSGWTPGEIIVDEQQLVVPANLPAGSLSLAAGLYRGDTGQRLGISGHPDNQIAWPLGE
jgi:4-amino-4-deoxy-L-arabinose transferase-like glycosyltransferase